MQFFYCSQVIFAPHKLLCMEIQDSTLSRGSVPS